MYLGPILRPTIPKLGSNIANAIETSVYEFVLCTLDLSETHILILVVESSSRKAHIL